MSCTSQHAKVGCPGPELGPLVRCLDNILVNSGRHFEYCLRIAASLRLMPVCASADVQTATLAETTPACM